MAVRHAWLVDVCAVALDVGLIDSGAVAAAVDTARQLEADAAAGWPKGYDAVVVARDAHWALDVLSAYVAESDDPWTVSRGLIGMLWPAEEVLL